MKRYSSLRVVGILCARRDDMHSVCIASSLQSMWRFLVCGHQTCLSGYQRQVPVAIKYLLLSAECCLACG